MSNTSEIKESSLPFLWFGCFLLTVLSAIISHRRHLENHGCVEEKVALLCSLLPFDPTWSTIHCLLRSIAAIPGYFSLSYAAADLKHFKKIWMLAAFCVRSCLFMNLCQEENGMDQLDIMSTTSWVVPLSWAGFTFVTAHGWGFAKVWVAVAGLCSLPATKAQNSEPAASAAGAWAEAAYLEQGRVQSSLGWG